MSRPAALPDRLWRTILQRLSGTGEPRVLFEYALSLPRGEPGRLQRSERWRWLVRAARRLPEAQTTAASWLRSAASPLGAADERRARSFERRAARAGVAEALRSVAWWSLARGRRNGWNSSGARRLRAAARRGDGMAAEDLAVRVETLAGDLARVERWLACAVRLDEGESDALWLLEFLCRAKPWLRRLRSRPAETWRERAERGDPVAQTHLAYAYRFGRGVPYDPESAQLWFERAADAGYAEAALALGLAVYDLEMDVDLGDAAARFEQASRSGDATAHWGAAWFHPHRGRPRPGAALRHLRVAAEQGHARAAYDLARRLALRGGGRTVRSEAARWMRRVAERGVPEAQAWFSEMRAEGTGVRRNPAEATAWLRRAAEEGNTDATLKLGVRLHEGRGTRRDDREAARWYRRAAVRGSPHAAYNLALCLKNGHGVRQNPAAALAWLRHTAFVLDHPSAARQLAWAYTWGWAGRKDPAEAARWLRHGAALGDAESLTQLGVRTHDGQGVPRDFALAALLYRAGAACGDRWAMHCLGLCHRDGEGVRKSLPEARRWFRRAARLGERRSAAALASLDRTFRAAPVEIGRTP